MHHSIRKKIFYSIRHPAFHVVISIRFLFVINVLVPIKTMGQIRLLDITTTLLLRGSTVTGSSLEVLLEEASPAFVLGACSHGLSNGYKSFIHIL